ncbi:hypothetical protein [Psychrobacter glacincola]|jgi:DNA polymerase III sliding clamp (beta) subunit (PCNA family)|uniref:hypothetical protein n=1 Tax=Psychrobacter glacincola TaxID=56810 RepID=UPI001918B834|nr:hypothetical protein [Psychrobacter glacincola]|tara:strand:+ start:182 stop:796 length:615 start_codon:yes stop_codon:yes gene_type:complete
MIVLYSSYLKAMLISTPKQDRREYLMGIYIRGIDERVEAFSSDGHRLSKWLITTTYQGEDFEFIIHRDAIEQALLAREHEVRLTPDGTLHTRISKITKLIDEPYPDIDKGVFSRISLEPNASDNPLINCHYLKDLYDIAKLLRTNRSPQFWPVNHPKDGVGPVVYTIEGVDDFIHIIMPMREDSSRKNKALKTIRNVAYIDFDN